MEHLLQAEDEFLLLGCDGLWDVFSSQRAVEFARSRLQQHNNPVLCSQELVRPCEKNVRIPFSIWFVTKALACVINW